MVSVERISLVTDGHEADERLIREYVVPSLDRLEALEGCEGVRFTRFGMGPWEKSEVKLGIYGDYEAVIESERDRWNELVSEGLIESWSRDGVPFEESPEEVREFLGRGYVLASKMAAEYYDEFDTQPDLLDNFPDEPEYDIGFGYVFHVLVNQLGYGPEEEVQAYMSNVRGRLRALTQVQDYETSRELVADLRAQLDDIEAEIDELEQQGGFDYYSGPEE